MIAPFSVDLDSLVPSPGPVRRLSDWFHRFLDRTRARRVVRAVAISLREHDAVAGASAMAFNLFLAAIPAIALCGWFTVALLRRDPRALRTIAEILSLAPADVHAVLETHVTRFSEAAVAPVVLLGSLWIAAGAFSTAMSILEKSLRAPPRPWWERRLIATACVIAVLFTVAAGATLVVLTSGGPLELAAKLAGGSVKLAKAVGASFAVLAAGLLTAGFFRIAVHRDEPGRVWPGAAVTVAIGALASYGFGAFVSRLGQYAAFYGSLAAVAVVLLWLWICCAALLLGAQVNAALDRVQ